MVTITLAECQVVENSDYVEIIKLSVEGQGGGKVCICGRGEEEGGIYTFQIH